MQKEMVSLKILAASGFKILYMAENATHTQLQTKMAPMQWGAPWEALERHQHQPQVHMKQSLECWGRLDFLSDKIRASVQRLTGKCQLWLHVRY